MTRDEVRSALEATLERNGMTGQSGVHVRLMITRGLKKSPNQDPRNTVSGPTVAIVAEYKEPPPELLKSGLSLFTSGNSHLSGGHVRHDAQHAFASQLHHGTQPGDQGGSRREALMLDDRGFVATCNATNFFVVRNGRVLTSTGANCFNGITRANIIELCDTHGIPCEQTDFTLAQVYDAGRGIRDRHVRRIDARARGGWPSPAPRSWGRFPPCCVKPTWNMPPRSRISECRNIRRELPEEAATGPDEVQARNRLQEQVS